MKYAWQKKNLFGCFLSMCKIYCHTVCKKGGGNLTIFLFFSFPFASFFLRKIIAFTVNFGFLTRGISKIKPPLQCGCVDSFISIFRFQFLINYSDVLFDMRS